MKKRIVFSIILFIIVYCFSYVYTMTRSSLDSLLAVGQLKDSVIQYSILQQIIMNDFIIYFIKFLFLTSFALIWVRPVYNSLQNISKYIAVCLFLFFMIGCLKPPQIELIEQIETNETAFLIPLEGKTEEGQAKFMSIDYLESAKVATKRISIPQREKKIGRFNHEIEWIPTMRVIKVDRAPVTREWTEEKNNGTSNKNEAIYVESKDSIGFCIGINITTMIKEEDSVKFLYYFAGKSLEKITDTNIRGKVTAILSKEFGQRDLSKCKIEKKEIQEILEKEIIVEYSKYGITVSNVGLVGGLSYEENKIQEAIDKAYVSEMSILEKENVKKAQEHENERVLSIAITERKSAQEFEKAYQAMIKKIELDIEMKRAEAMLQASKKWDGSTPASILPQGSSLLFGLDSSVNK